MKTLSSRTVSSRWESCLRLHRTKFMTWTLLALSLNHRVADGAKTLLWYSLSETAGNPQLIPPILSCQSIQPIQKRRRQRLSQLQLEGGVALAGQYSARRLRCTGCSVTGQWIFDFLGGQKKKGGGGAESSEQGEAATPHSFTSFRNFKYRRQLQRWSLHPC